MRRKLDNITLYVGIGVAFIGCLQVFLRHHSSGLVGMAVGAWLVVLQIILNWWYAKRSRIDP